MSDKNENITPITGQKVNLGDIYNNEMMNLKIVDASTGRPIEIPHIQDSIRVSGREDEISRDKSTIYTRTIPNETLGQFVLTKKEHFNARSCVEALGLYNTEYIKKQITTLGTKQDSYSAMEDNTIVNNLTFSNYIKGGMSPRSINGKTKNIIDNYDKGYSRISGNLGIGLGESTVLNPTFQFNKRDDPRTNPLSTKIGRVYSTSIMNNWPVAFFQPGRLKYNTGFFKMMGLFGGAGVADTYIRSGGEGLWGIISGAFMTAVDIVGVIGTIGSAIFGGSKVVEFKQSCNLYDKYLNSLLNQMASLMGLFKTGDNGDVEYCGSISNLDLTHILPTMHMNGGIARYLYNQFIPFRIQKGMIGSESFSNSTETNPLQESMNATATENAEEGSNNSNIMQSLKKFGMGILGKFSDQAAVLSGNGRITLPDIYSSSSFSRSFTCSMTFHYPYGDVLGKFENLYLQLIFLLVLGLPRQTGKFTYTTPFATRVFVKNHIWISYGMIESISVTRGGDINDWCPDGHPKTLKVDVNIKDMEPNIMLPLAARGPLRMGFEVMFPTSGLSEYFMSIGGCSLDYMTHNFRKEHFVNAADTFKAGWNTFWNRDSALSHITNNRIVSSVLNLFNSVDVDKLTKIGDPSDIGRKMTTETMANAKFYDTKNGMLRMMTGGGVGTWHEALTDYKEDVSKLKDVQTQMTGQGS